MVPRQYTTGGKIRLAACRTQVRQAARELVAIHPAKWSQLVVK